MGLMAEALPYLWYRYTFTFDDGVKKVFEARLDPNTLTMIPPATVDQPRTDLFLRIHRVARAFFNIDELIR